MFDLILLIFTN